MTKFAFPVMTPLLKRRLVYVLVIALALAATFTFISLRAQAMNRTNDAATKLAWQSTPSFAASSSAPSADAVFARFNIRRSAAPAGGSDEFVWQAANASELRASLAALDAAKVALRQVKVTRSGAVFAVAAERAQ